jgi:alkylhydroperoxidase family enzyme
MAFIDYISYDNASDKLKELYRKFGGADKTPANILRIAGEMPDLMDAHIQFYRTLMMGKSPLSRRQRESIAVVVSGINRCHY